MPPGFLHQALCPSLCRAPEEPVLGSRVPAWPSKAWGSPTAGLSTSQFRKDMATQRKDPKGQSLSVLRLQNRDQLLQAPTSHSLELQSQDLKSRWALLFPSRTL